MPSIFRQSCWLVVVGILCGWSGEVVAAASGGEEEPTLPVRRVALYTSGVGYFQHSGEVSGGAEIRLPFSASQISDVLKSLVMEDVEGAVPGSVLYPSEDAKQRILSGFQVDLTNNPTLADVLTQLRGSRMTALYKGTSFSGRLLGVEQRPLMGQGADSEKPTMDWFLNLATSEGFRVVPLRALSDLVLDKASDQQDLIQALEALDDIRRKSSKHMILRFPGQGTRKVRLGYVVESPVWKSSYRLILPDQGEAEKDRHPARIQGWAVVENQSDNDWHAIQLSLVSGRPLSFEQDLYKPRYIRRPIVEPRENSGIQPETYQGGVRHVAQRSLPRPVAAKALSEFMQDESGSVEADSAPEGAWLSEPVRPSMVTAASGEEAGALFQFTVEGVDLPRRRGAMIPFVSTPIKMEKVSIYNGNTLSDHPLNGVFLENTTAIHLPSGPVTLFDGGVYAGDALLADLPAGEKRLLSYGIDLEVTVVSSQTPQESQITQGRIAKGVLHYVRKLQSKQTFQLDNRGEEQKNLIVERPRRPGWQVVGEMQPFETTQFLDRFRLTVPAHERVDLTVQEARILDSHLALVHGQIGPLLQLSQEGALSADVQKALSRAAELHGQVQRSMTLIREAKQKIGERVQEQERIRANLQTVDAQSRFYGRMMSKLDAEETMLEQKQRQIETLELTKEKEQRQLEDYLENLVLN